LPLAHPAWQKGKSPWIVDSNSLATTATSLSVDLKNTQDESVTLILKVTALSGGTVRVHVDDKNPPRPRHQVQDVLQTLQEIPMTTKLVRVR
jgi:hypothetical protein